MTLSERNLFFKAGITFCAFFTILILFASVVIFPFYSTMEKSPVRPVNLFQRLAGLFLESSHYAVHISLISAVLFSFIGMMLIHYFFERTSTVEILYISLFAASFSFEIIRLILPMHLIYGFSSFYLLGASRVLLFARCFSIFSLFTASILAAGFEAQKTRNIILIIVVTALVITFSVPFDVFSWDTGFNSINGYASMFRLIDTAAFLATAAGFFVAIRVRGSGDYAYAGVGVALAMLGRSALLGTDNWAGFAFGILLLAFGTSFLCSKIHKIHLWL